jgi:flavocytochrome c
MFLFINRRLKQKIMPENVIKTDAAFDTAVIGSGFAGLSAAIEAHNAGAAVVIIEKMHAPGGNSLISDGGMAAAGTEEQAAQGISDSPELFYNDMLNAGLGINHPDLVKTVTRNSREAFEWLKDYLDVEFMEKIEIFGGHSVQRCFTAKNITGATIIKKQIEKIKELGISIKYHTLFTGFIKNGSGRISGIRVRENYNFKTGRSGDEKSIMLKKGVILAAGGFGSDIDFRSAQDPRLGAEIDTTNQPFATSGALKEALHAGACPVQLSHIQLGPWASPDEKGYGDGPSFSEYIVFQRGLIVDPATGCRIVNELADRKTLSDAILRTGHPCTGIADSHAVEKSGWNIDKCLGKGVVKKFDTLEALADFYEINRAVFLKTVVKFNSYIRGGADKDFGKPVIETAAEITSPPFYAIRLWPKVHHTMGGVRINTAAQVLDFEGRPIEGLYAAGEITGGVHGACRLGSCAITECIVIGRIAGQMCAREQ